MISFSTHNDPRRHRFAYFFFLTGDKTVPKRDFSDFPKVMYLGTDGGSCLYLQLLPKNFKEWHCFVFDKEGLR